MQTLTKKHNHWPRFLLGLFVCALFLLIDLVTYGLCFFPFLSHGLIFYLILYRSRFSWVVYCLFLGLSLDLINNLPLGINLSAMFVFSLSASYVRTLLNQGNFLPIWLSFGGVELGWLIFVEGLSMGFFYQPFSYELFLKSFLTWCFFPLILNLLIRKTT